MIETIRIVKAVRTCYAYPSQWDAWTDDGRYLYLRYRYGHGTVDHFPGGDIEVDAPYTEVAAFETGDDGGLLGLEEFCERAGIELALTEPAVDAEFGYERPKPDNGDARA